jgi:hypothetical protein
MVWNWEIFDDNLIKVAQALASRSSRHFVCSRAHETSVPGMKIFARPRRAETQQVLMPIVKQPAAASAIAA